MLKINITIIRYLTNTLLMKYLYTKIAKIRHLCYFDLFFEEKVLKKHNFITVFFLELTGFKLMGLT